MASTKILIREIFNCSIERAYKSPILGDATKYLGGHLFQPPVIGFEDDETWGREGGYRYPITNGNLFLKRGRVFKDEILERVENEYWKWTIYNFEVNSLFFAEKAIAEWRVVRVSENKYEVEYSYDFYSKNIFLQPINWLFMQLQYKGMMKKALKGIKAFAESDQGFIY